MKLPIIVSPEVAIKLREWLDAGRGIAVWQNCNLSSHSIGNLSFTPGDKPSPGWQFGNSPVHTTSDAQDFRVQSWNEVERIKVRPGKYGPPCHPVTKADIPKLDKAIARAGDGAEWRFDFQDYSCVRPWVIAVIETPGDLLPI